MLILAMLLCVAPSAAAAPVATIADWIQACKPTIPEAQSLHYARLIQASSRRHRIDPALAVALISVESDFNPRERSHVGAVGLTQIMPFRDRLVAWRVSRGGLMRPDINIDRGLFLFSQLHQKARGNRTHALNMYVGHRTRLPTRYSRRILARASLLRTGRFSQVGKEFSRRRGM